MFLYAWQYIYVVRTPENVSFKSRQISCDSFILLPHCNVLHQEQHGKLERTQWRNNARFVVLDAMMREDERNLLCYPLALFLFFFSIIIQSNQETLITSLQVCPATRR